MSEESLILNMQIQSHTYTHTPSLTNCQDTVAPTIRAGPTHVECSAALPFPSASDSCDFSLAIGFTDVRANGTCSGQYAIQRTVVATDSCNNNATALQIINVVVR